jgi:hypothetical protein
MTLIDPVVADDSESVATPPAPSIRNPQSAIRSFFGHRSFYLITLLVLIVIGGVMRFTFLDRPPIWFDEAATFARTSAT